MDRVVKSIDDELDFDAYCQTKANEGNCKRCPHCYKTIVKDGGCRYVRCGIMNDGHRGDHNRE